MMAKDTDTKSKEQKKTNLDHLQEQWEQDDQENNNMRTK